jgi:ABC-2 type transport system permease protein
MRAFVVLTRMRLLDVLRSASSVGFILFFPIVLLVVTGLVFLEGHPFERRTVLVVGDVERARAALAAFEEARVEPARSQAEAEGRIRSRMASAALVDGRLIVGPRDQLFGRGLRELLPGAPPLEVLAVPEHGYVHYLFPGILAFSVMASGLFATGHTLVLYRQNRFLKKLATTPLPKATFVLAQITARSLLVMAQAALLVLAARLLFGAPFTLVGLLWLAAITLLGLLAFMGVGFALACVITTEDLVVDIISGVQLPLILLSEIFFPLAALPRALGTLGEWLPSTEMVRLARAVLLYGETDPAVLLPGLAFMAGWAALTFVVSVGLFKWHE